MLGLELVHRQGRQSVIALHQVPLLIQPGVAHMQLHLPRDRGTQGQHQLQVFAVDGAEHSPILRFGAHRQHGVIGPDRIARQQSQEAPAVGTDIVLPVHIPEQRVAVDPVVVDEAGATDERGQRDLPAQGQQRGFAGVPDQREYVSVGPLGMMQHRLHQAYRLGGGQLGLLVQGVQIVAVQLPQAHRGRKRKHQQGT
ncbi:hypothetical protein D3C76_1178270 [compost metagenome]